MCGPRSAPVAVALLAIGTAVLLELNASALILVHNHPSGDPTPSQADIDMTAQIQSAADVLGITLHDHLVIGRSRELSFRSEGLL